MPLHIPRPSTFALTVALATGALVGTHAVAQKSSPSTDQRVQRVEANLVSIPMSGGQPPLQFNLQQLMNALNVPGLTVTVIDDFKPSWTKTYGVTEAGTSTPVTPQTLFQAGSISKPVAATGALYLVEHGKLSLDANVNEYLKTWKVPDNEFTTTQKVTLRRLLSHTAGLTVHGFPGYAVGEPIPTTVQIFNGEKPANTDPIRVDFVPGSKVRYSGGGVTIEQQMIVDVTGKPFPEFMRDTVLGPMGMKSSSYQQPLPTSLASLAASGTRADGKTIPGKWHIYPEMAAAGLWTTSGDLAKFAINIALSKNGKANNVLSESMTRQMLTPQLENAGLGFFLNMGGNPNAFGHNGADEGFQAILVMISDTGQGAAIMANSDNGAAIGNYLVNSIAREYGWKYAAPKSDAAGALSLVEITKGAKAAIQEYHYLHENAASQFDFNEGTLNQLGYDFLTTGDTQDAIQVFQMNVQEYPKSWNSYDSLGEAYMKAGQKELAIENYTKSIKMNPGNKNGAEMLKKLKEQK
jgi:CubicO group peptidase (beta-lactamase class C family)